MAMIGAVPCPVFVAAIWDGAYDVIAAGHEKLFNLCLSLHALGHVSKFVGDDIRSRPMYEEAHMVMGVLLTYEAH
jgi:hypothetical protein